MKSIPYILLLCVVLALAGSAWLFWVQNSQQEVMTSFEVWGGLRWGRVWKAPELIAVSGGIGALLGLVLGWWGTSTLKNRTIRNLRGSAGGNEQSW
jgi:hypothetical protein